MNPERPGGLAARWERLSTGLKMLLILSLGLLPLGVIAVLASIDSARDSRAKVAAEAQGLLAVHAQQLSLALSRSAITIRAASDAIAESGDEAGICARTLDRLNRLPTSPGRYALYGEDNRLRCATPGFVPPPVPAARGRSSHVEILDGGNRLRVVLYDEQGEAEGLSEYRRAALSRIVVPRVAGRDFALELVQGERIMSLRESAGGGPLSREVTASQSLASNQLAFRIRAAAMPMSMAELLIILMPVAMWLWASLVGWVIVQRLLLRPLSRIQNVISAYRPGDRALDLPTVRSPAQEIGALGRAFDRVTQTVARHEAELEAAVERQTRLVREVHHRVKNNLQVVASLLNLHSRGSPNEEVAAAYASIQRRVDALAVVHRNHYAELEENRGVALKPLVSELAANLRATAPASASAMQIRLDIGPFYATQDAAVSLAFLVTEVVEFGMLCGAAAVSIVLEPDKPGSARLSIEVDSLAGEIDCDESLLDRFDRIITGLARQLRSSLDRDPERGCYSVAISVVDQQA